MVSVLIPGIEGLLAGLPSQLCDTVHCPIERLYFPIVRVGSPVEDLGLAMRVHHQLISIGAFGAEGPLVDGTTLITLYIDYLAPLDVNALGATDCTVGANTIDGDSSFEARMLVYGIGAEGLRAVAEPPEEVWFAFAGFSQCGSPGLLERPVGLDHASP